MHGRSVENCTFRPQINPSNLGDNEFFTRLEKTNQKRSLKEYELKLKKAAGPVDDKSGKPLFQPAIGRPPKRKDRSTSRSFMEAQDRSMRSTSKNNTSRQTDNSGRSNLWAEEHRRPLTSRSTDVYYETKMKKEFKKIFELMDSDQNGEISSDKIEIRTLNPDILKVISPFLSQMEEHGQVLTEKDFCDDLWEFLKTLTPYDRDKIMKSQKTREKPKMPETKVNFFI